MGELRKFSAREYIKQLGDDLVQQFSAASMATTPGLIGSARESAVRGQLEGLLGSDASIGTGCVISIDGAVSQQQDLVVFEKHFGTHFMVAGSVSYFPCESVIAVGEVKTELNSTEMRDVMSKCFSVKTLKRQIYVGSNLQNEPTAYYRHFGSRNPTAGTKAEEFDPSIRSADRILFFALAGRKNISSGMVVQLYSEAWAEDRLALPDIMVTLDGLVVIFANCREGRTELVPGSAEANSILIMRDHPAPFSKCVAHLRRFISYARTTPLESLNAYFEIGGYSSEIHPLA